MRSMEASAVPRLAPAGVSLLRSPHVLRLAPDSHLVALIREGRHGAFEAVYDRHHRGILSFCRHMLGDPQEAEDAVQHTFLAAYDGLISSHKQIHLRAWLFAIARNRCYSMIRARREQPAADIDDAITEGLATQVQRRQELRDLVLDMQRLPDDQRAALVLAELDSLSHVEIAQALGVPREKVKALVFQARESLVASRAARETDCAEIRELLATQRGGALRRANLRRHLRECSGCRSFKRQVERQRHQLAILLPVVPTIALKQGVLTASVSGGAPTGIAGGSLVLSSAVKSGLAKVVIGAVVAGMGTAGTIVATTDLRLPLPPSVSHRHRAAGTTSEAAGPAITPSAGVTEALGAEPSHVDVPHLSGIELPAPVPVEQPRTASLPTGGVSFVPPGPAVLAGMVRSTTIVLDKSRAGAGSRPTRAAPVMAAPPSITTTSFAGTSAPVPDATSPPADQSIPHDVPGGGAGISVGRRGSAGHRGGDGGYGDPSTGRGSPGGGPRGVGHGNAGNSPGVAPGSGGGGSGGGQSSSSGSGTADGPAGSSGSDVAGGADGASTSTPAAAPTDSSGAPGGADGSNADGGSGGSGASAGTGGASVSPHRSADASGDRGASTPPHSSSGSASRSPDTLSSSTATGPGTSASRAGGSHSR
jgi:RNA polymerase sigma factor (sigma-70 family)